MTNLKELSEQIRKETEQIREEIEQIREENERLRRENEALRSLTPDQLSTIVEKSIRKPPQTGTLSTLGVILVYNTPIHTEHTQNIR